MGEFLEHLVVGEVGGFPEHLVVDEVGEVGEFPEHLVAEEVEVVGEFPDHMGLARLVHLSLVDWHQPTVNEVDDEFRRGKTYLELK